MTRLPHRSLVIVALALARSRLRPPPRPARPRADATPTCPSRTGRTTPSRRSPSAARPATRSWTTTAQLFKPEDGHHPRAAGALAGARLRQLRRERQAVAIKDVTEADRYYDVIQVALHHGYMKLDKDGDFSPQDPVPAYQAEVAIVRWLKETLRLVGLDPAHESQAVALAAQRRLEDRARRRYLPYIVASRQLQLRYNHPVRRRRARGLAGAAHRSRRGRLHVLARLRGRRRVDALGPRRLRQRRLPAAERPPEADRRASPSSSSAIRTSGPASIRPRTRPTALRPPAASTARASSSGS